MAKQFITVSRMILLAITAKGCFTQLIIEKTKNKIFIRSVKMNADELSTIEAAKVVDARAMACPGPLLEAKKSIGQVKVGEVLEIWSGDVNTKNDMPRWCQKVGHEYLGDSPGDGYDRLFIRRAK
jgi:tRNA 2-thiouridine synthesizing protein A